MSKSIMQLSWQELELVNKEQAIFFVNLAPIEQHGKHLPIGVDVYLTEHWQTGASELLVKQGYNEIFHMPVLPFGYATATSFNGNLYFSKKTLYNVVFEVLSNISSWGFKNIIVLSAHADPIHNIVIERACDKINSKYGLRVLAPMGAIFSGEKVGIYNNNCGDIQGLLTDYPHDYHAGWIETSAMLHLNKSLVKESYTDMPNIEIDPRYMLSEKKMNKVTAGFGHFGYPKHANTALGERLNTNMIAQICEATVSFVKRMNYEKYQHHFLYENLLFKLLV